MGLDTRGLAVPDGKPPAKRTAKAQPAKATPRKAAPAKAAPKGSARGKRVAAQVEATKRVTAADRRKAAAQVANVVPIKGRTRAEASPRGRGRPGSTTSPEALAIHDRRIRAMNLRRLGSTWAEVAENMHGVPGCPPGYNKSDAYNDVKAILDKVTVEAVADLRNEDLAILASLQRTAYPKALEGEDPVWMDKMLRILDQRAKYTGLYAPVKHALAGADGGPITIATASPEDIYHAAVSQLDALLPHVPPPELPGTASS